MKKRVYIYELFRFSKRKISSFKKESKRLINTSVTPPMLRESRALSEISKKSRSILAGSTDEESQLPLSKDVYTEGERNVYGYLKIPGKTKRITRNTNPIAFSMKKHKADQQQIKILEQKRKVMSKTESYYLSNRKIKVLKQIQNDKDEGKKISIMEMIPKANNTITQENEQSNSNLSSLISNLKIKKTKSKEQIRAKLECLRTQSADGRRR